MAEKPQLEPPAPTEVDEKLPKLSMSNKPNELPDQPQPEPEGPKPPPKVSVSYLAVPFPRRNDC